MRGDTKHEGSSNVSALVISFRKSNFKLPQLKMFICVYILVLIWQFEFVVETFFFRLKDLATIIFSNTVVFI